MSTLKKLHIQGIRSFNPRDDKSQAIEFFTPLTLIVGQNGCGKTTIIEALKYVITNSFPPGTDKGKYFVNDPKLSSGYEVMGMARLEILDTAGTLVQCTRRIKSTQQKSKQPKTQSLEGTIRVKGKDGSWKELSSKCVDLKMEMSRYMGVSDAILEYVIFCHQEDSCWPLDEAKKVKERFDDIFNTTGYMTSLKLLNDQDKELGAKSKVEAQALAYAEKDMKILKTKTREKEQLDIQLQAMIDTEAEYEQQREKLVTELKRLEIIEAKLAAFAAEVNGLKVQVQEGEKAIVDLQQNIKEEFTGDIEELQANIQDFKMDVSKKHKDIQKTSDELHQKDKDLARLRRQQEIYLVKEGEFQKSEMDNKECLTRIQAIAGQVVTLLRKVRSSTQDSNLSNVSINSVDTFIEACEENPDSISPDVILKAISVVIRGKDSEFSKTKATLEGEENVLQKNIDKLRSEKASLEKEVELKKDQIVKYKKGSEDLKKRLNAIEGSNDALALLDDDEEAVTEKIEKIEKSGVIAKYENDIVSIGEEVKDLERSVSNVAKKVELLGKDKQLTDQIAIYNRQKLQKQNDCSEIMRRVEDHLSMVLESVPKENVGAALENKIKSLKSQASEKQKAVQIKEREKTKYEAELKQVSNELNKKERALSDWKNQTAELLEEGDFHEKFDELTEELDNAQKNSYFGEAAVWLNKKFINQMNKKACCPLCKRNFGNRNEVQSVQNDIEKKVNDLLESRPAQKEAVEKLKEKHQTYADLKPSWEENSKLEEEEIPSLKKVKRELEDKLKTVKAELKELEESLEILLGDSSVAQNVTKDVTIYDTSIEEIKRSDESIRRTEKLRDRAAIECEDTLNDAQAELESLQGSITSKRLEKDNKDALRTRKRDELAAYQSEKNRIQKEKLQITSEMQNREALEAQKREIEENTKSCQDGILDLGRKIPAIKNDILNAEKTKQDFVKEKENKLQQIRNEKESFQSKYNNLGELKQQIEKFDVEKQNFARIQERISESKEQMERLESELHAKRQNLDKLKKEVTEHEIKERDLMDNLRLKQKFEEVGKLRVKLAKKEKDYESVESGGVGTKKRELSGKYNKVNDKLNESRGRSAETKKAILAINKEINETYKNAEDDYIERFVRKTVLDKAQVDCRRYRKVLDHAILTFHKKRMESINRSLKKYWQQVYKGNDVDMIQIKTENEDAKDDKKIELKTARRSYSYRVVMYKRGVELDMRGRCSAGQKVLASILIRISLAEAFSSKCGIIALDEPTTNLDENNIKALSDCLVSLARRMSTNKTFQLIVITHDQPFLDRLIDIDVIEHYYKVKRDANGYSQIIQVDK
ncbi:unnamed protein product [Allacma fusca]|uniref:Uncharacterized protein n=1 Tax=Allacma fusca TaxID=39272 RepID=A0A8J2PZR0_9HEXA|nr:unnamed protein product [Allacma fusca]